jgi:hypothetical protein
MEQMLVEMRGILDVGEAGNEKMKGHQVGMEAKMDAYL